jgi:AraC-like DNA-binding protein/quercetin dioxygenase-like cupin family protein
MPIEFSPSEVHRRSPAVQTLAHHYTQGAQLDLHQHKQAQLLFAPQGLMQVTTPKGRWLVPPQRAVWLPPSISHSIQMLTDIEMRTLYIEPDWIAGHPEAHRLGNEFVVAVGALLQGLVLTFFDQHSHPLRIELAAKLMLFELTEARDATTFIPMPDDTRTRRIAESALRDPKGLRSFEELAHEAGISQRTAARLFSSQTDLTFKKWRQRARMMAAVEMLSAKRVLIKQVSAHLGYSSTSSFTASFHEVMGMTPRQFLDELHASSGLG